MKNPFSKLMVIFFGITGMTVVATGLLCFVAMMQPVPADAIEIDANFIYIVPALAVVGAITSNVIPSILISKFKSTSGEEVSLEKKFNTWQSARIIKLALLEGPAMFAAVSILLTGNYLYLGVVGFMLVLMVFSRPTKSAMIADLDLTSEEANRIEMM